MYTAFRASGVRQVLTLVRLSIPARARARETWLAAAGSSSRSSKKVRDGALPGRLLGQTKKGVRERVAAAHPVSPTKLIRGPCLCTWSPNSFGQCPGAPRAGELRPGPCLRGVQHGWVERRQASRCYSKLGREH